MTMVINVYNMYFRLLGVLDTFSSVIWRPAYYETGDCEIYTSATKEAVELLQEGNLVVRSHDISVDADGEAVYKNVMVIRGISLKTDEESGDWLTVTGVELKSLLHQRVVWKQTNLSGTAGDGIKRLVEENAQNPEDRKREIPRLVTELDAGLTDRIEKQLTGDFLDEAVKGICKTYGYGWEITGRGQSFVLHVYKGADRSYTQTGRPYVVFSEYFDNLYNTEYQLDTANRATTALVAGEGEGTQRVTTAVNNDTSGLERYEIFVDARDVSSNADSEEETIPRAQYQELLKERGIEKLAEIKITEGFSGEVSGEGNFRYGQDFFLGDTVTVTNRYGIQKNVKVLSTVESEDENGEKLIPQFNF